MPDWFELKAYADDILNSVVMMVIVCDSFKNLVGKRDVLITRIFSFSHGVFKSFFFLQVLKTRDCEVKTLKVALQILGDEIFT